jgi:hypothetical protein
LIQALSTPGITEEQKQTITETYNTLDSLPDGDKAQVSSELQSIISQETPGTPNSTTSTLDSNLKGNSTGTTGNYSFDMNNPQVWNDYVNQFYDTALEQYQTQAKQINEATGKANTSLDALTGSTTAARDKQTGLLDNLISNLQAGNNYSPVKFNVGGNDVSFIPRANRDTATLISNLGQNNVSNATSTASTNAPIEQQKVTNTALSSTAGNAILSYLGALKNLASDETKKIATEKGIDINQQQVEQNEPGILDYLKGIGSASNSIFGSNAGGKSAWDTLSSLLK